MKRLLFGVLVVLLLITAAGIISFRLSEQYQIIYITGKFAVRDGGYILTDSGESFKVADSIPNLHFDSSDIFKSLEIGVWYKVKVSGWQLDAPLKMYRNIIEAVKLNESSAVFYKENE